MTELNLKPVLIWVDFPHTDRNLDKNPFGKFYIPPILFL